MNPTNAAMHAAQAIGFSYDVTETARDAGRLYWGPGALPASAEIAGIVRRPTGETGALIRIGRVYVQGNAGSLRSLPLRGQAVPPGERPPRPDRCPTVCWDEAHHCYYPEHDYRDYGESVHCTRCGEERPEEGGKA